MIPLVDLARQHAEIADEVAGGFAEVVQAADFVGGKPVTAFESDYADYIGVRHCIGVGNGTDALELSLRALGVGTGDEVVLPANTFVATAEAVWRCGARPVLVDVDPDHLLMRPESVPPVLTERTKAVLPVHLYGQAAPVERLHEVLPPGVVVVEDAAQAQGARRHGRAAGSLGAAAATSFYPGKNLGAYGDAGAVLTDSTEIADTLRRMRNHGGDRRYRHEHFGCNSRLDTLQAVVLLAKLARLDAWNADRASAAARYDELLSDIPGVRRPAVLAGNEHVWHLYVVRVPDRDRVMEEMQRAGIGVGVHYPIPVHLQPAFGWLDLRAGDFPVTEAAAAEILSLPLFPGITPDEQDRVVTELRKALR